MVVVGEPAAGETIFINFISIYVVLVFFFWGGGIWPSGKAAIFDVVSVGSNPSIPIFWNSFFLLLKCLFIGNL